MRDLLAQDKILFGDSHDKIIELKVYAKEFLDKLPSVIELDGRTAAYELRDLFPDRRKAFDTPKPTQLVEKVLSYATRRYSIVLDSFAGSGTTAHAVMNLNAKDEGQRRFILVEGEGYADELTRERVARVQVGVPGATAEPLKSGLGGSFTYCTLGDPVELDHILTGEDLPSFDALAGVLFHMATSQPLDPARMDEARAYVGEAGGTHVWLIYRPDLDWLKSPEAALTLSFARKVADARPDARHLVFAPARNVSQRLLDAEGVPVEFVPLPFALYRVERS